MVELSGSLESCSIYQRAFVNLNTFRRFMQEDLICPRIVSFLINHFAAQDGTKKQAKIMVRTI